MFGRIFVSRLNITSKFVSYMLLIGVVPLVTAGIIAYETAKNSLVDQSLNEQQVVLNGLKDNISLIQDQVEGLLANLSGVEAINNALKQPQDTITSFEQLSTEVQIGYILNGFLNIKGLVSIHIVGESGGHYQVGDTLDSQINESVAAQIREAAQTNSSVVYWVGVTDNLNALSQHEKVVAVTKSLFYTNRSTLERRRIGILVVNYSLESLSRIFRQSSESTQVYLVDRNKRFIYHPDSSFIGRQTARPVRSIATKYSGHQQLITPDGSFYRYEVPIQRSEWTLISEVSETQLLSKVEVIRNTILIIVFVALIFVGLIAVHLTRTLISPLKHITDSFKKLKRGDAAVEKLPVLGQDEVSQLVQWFNQFLDELHKRNLSERELKMYQQQLEEMVAERTSQFQTAKDEAEKANAIKSQFLANMSHELRTPMHAITSFTSLGLNREQDPRIKRYLQNIKISSERLTDLLNDLLDLSRLESGKYTVNLESVDLSDVVSAAINEVSGLLHERSIAIEFDPINSVAGEFDRKLMIQVFVNLLSNAIKFSPENSRIKILQALKNVDLSGSTQEVTEFVFIDQGVGIPKDELKDIFDSFVQSSKTRSASGGTGLGLPITNEIVLLHQGAIWAESPPPGSDSGAAFFVRLPLQQSDIDSPGTSAQHIRSASSR